MTKKVRIARDSSDPELLTKMANSLSVQVRLEVALNPHTPQSAVHVLAHDVKAQIVAAAIRHPNVPSEIVNRFGVAQTATIREVVIASANVEAGLLADRMIKDRSQAVRYAAETRISTASMTFDEFRALANHESAQVRAAVASNTNMPKEILAGMARKPNEELAVRVAVANNSNLEPDILRDMGLTKYLIDHSIWKNANMTPAILLTLSEDASLARARIIAGHQKANKAVLEKLLQEYKNPHMWEAVAMHPDSTAEMLAESAKENATTATLEKIRTHPNASSAAKERAELLLISRDYNSSDEQVRRLIRDDISSQALAHARGFPNISKITRRDIDETLVLRDTGSSDEMIRRLIDSDVVRHTEPDVLRHVAGYENASSKTKKQIERILRAKEIDIYTLERR